MLSLYFTLSRYHPQLKLPEFVRNKRERNFVSRRLTKPHAAFKMVFERRVDYCGNLVYNHVRTPKSVEYGFAVQ